MRRLAAHGTPSASIMVTGATEDKGTQDRVAEDKEEILFKGLGDAVRSLFASKG